MRKRKRSRLRMIRIKNPDKLRARLQRVEAKIKEIVNKRHNGYSWHMSPVQRDKIEFLLIDRSAYLDRMFLATPEEVKRFEDLNDKLIKMADDMRARSAMLWETMVGMKKMPEFDDEYEVEGILKVQGWDDEDEVLKLPEDEYYGSDFQFMSEVLHEMVPECMCQARCLCSSDLDHFKRGETDSNTAFTDTMEDGTTWAEGSLRHPALSHICICHPIHDICTHNPFSIPDLLRINDFKTTVTLTIEHRVTQSGIRSSEPGFRPWLDAPDNA